MPRRQLDFHDFNSIGTEIDRLEKNGYNQVGQWNLSRTCDHLAKTMRMSLEGFPHRAPWYVRLVAPMVKGRFFRKRRMPEGFPAPSGLEPSDDKAAVQLCKDFLTRVCDAKEFHLHPVFGKLSPEEWRQVHLIHSSHHLSFLIPNA
jgi:Protein of unknown function (DUF1569)